MNRNGIASQRQNFLLCFLDLSYKKTKNTQEQNNYCTFTSSQHCLFSPFIIQDERKRNICL